MNLACYRCKAQSVSSRIISRARVLASSDPCVLSIFSKCSIASCKALRSVFIFGILCGFESDNSSVEGRRRASFRDAGGTGEITLCCSVLRPARHVASSRGMPAVHCRWLAEARVSYLVGTRFLSGPSPESFLGGLTLLKRHRL